MTRNCKIALLGALMFITAIETFAVVRPRTIYAYGFSASFNDSTVYFTEIQEIDSAWINKGNDFLYSREGYSFQLKEYLLRQGAVNPTCMISYAFNLKDAKKKYANLRKKYTKSGKNANAYIIRDLTNQDFRFVAISALGDPDVVTDDSKEARKAEKAAQKKAREEAKAKDKAIKHKGGYGKRPMGPPPTGGPGGGMGPGGGR